MEKVLFVTSNAGKFEALCRVIKKVDAPFLVERVDCQIDEIQSHSQHVVAERKARDAWKIIRSPLLIDDGGLFIKKYWQFPGTLSKYIYQSLGRDAFLKLFDPGDKGRFSVMLSFADAHGQVTTFNSFYDGILRHPKADEIDPRMPFCRMLVDAQTGAMPDPDQLMTDAFTQFSTWYRTRSGVDKA
jgi:XTP/dITP diphosphohydrolase